MLENLVSHVGKFMRWHGQWAKDTKRCWLYIGPLTWRFAIGRVRGSRWADLSWGEGYVEGIQISAGLGYGFWFTFQPSWKARHRIPRWPDTEREIGIKWYDGTLDLLIYHDPMGGWGRGKWGNRLKLWRNDWVTGRAKYAKREIMPPMPQTLAINDWPGDEYRVLIAIEEATWRKRFSTTRCTYYEYSIPDGEQAAGFSGKGENSWDCGDDAIYGMSVDVRDVEGMDGALAHFANIVQRSRKRYGRPSYAPRERVTA